MASSLSHTDDTLVSLMVTLGLQFDRCPVLYEECRRKCRDVAR